MGSDDKYCEIVRQIDKNTPSRFNSDSRLLYGASGSAGKIAVFAVRLDTYISPKENKVFYLGIVVMYVFGNLVKKHPYVVLLVSKLLVRF